MYIFLAQDTKNNSIILIKQFKTTKKERHFKKLIISKQMIVFCTKTREMSCW